MKIPSLIYGTAWKEEATADLVKAVISAGFNAVDTANHPRHYQEPLVGAALQVIFDSGIKREVLHVKYFSVHCIRWTSFSGLAYAFF